MKNIRLIKLLIIILAISFVAAACNTKKENQPLDNPTVEQKQTVYSYKGQNGKTALELLRSMWTVETKTFSGVGEFVENINGVKADSKHFWAFYVNGQAATKGAGDYKTTDSDQIEWKLEEIKANPGL